MQFHHADREMPYRVLAVFESSAAVFEVSRVATLGDLAGRLAQLSGGHDGALMSVDVGVGSGHAKDGSSLRTGTLGDSREKHSAKLLSRNRRSIYGAGRAT